MNLPDSYVGQESSVDQVRTQVWDDVHSLTHQDVGWSRTRYTGFSLVAVDVKPAPVGQLSSVTVKALAQNGREIDRLQMYRVAGPGAA